MRKQHKPVREPRTLAQQLDGEHIDCLRCEQRKPAAGSRPFHGHPVCSDCCAQLDKFTTKETS
jgi:transposase-like protein